MKPKLTESDFIRAAERLRCEVAAIKAVAQVESRGAGFYGDGFPVILFERHIFRRETKGKYNTSHPHLSGPQGNYGPAGKNQRVKFSQAFALNPDAAMKSCSWGKFQIMGFNHKPCGYATVGEFVDAMKQDEGKHLDAFVEFVESQNLGKHLRKKDFTAFARGYNGSGYAKNKYDTKMLAAYGKFQREPSSSAATSQNPSVKEGTTQSAQPQDPATLAADAFKTETDAGSEITVTTETSTSTGKETTEVTTTQNVVVEKKEGWFKRKWKEIAAFVSGNSLLDGFSERLAQVQALGLPARFWTNLVYFTIGGAVIYLAFDWYRDYQERKLTNKLIDANSTPTNLVQAAPKSQLAAYDESPDWQVIRKS